MACGCNRRARAAKAGQTIAGYRVMLPDGVTVIPAEPQAPFMSPAEARAEVRKQGGGTAFTVYRQTA